jgi:(p)ppGpp synthase/HD superfamily hydrolase
MAEQTNRTELAVGLSQRFADALAFAFEVHRTQTKKATRIPYVSHLLEVAGTVLTYGGDEDEAIAALLHDAVEDHSDAVSFASLAQRFGTRVAAIVESCSDTSVSPKPPWKARKERYIDHLSGADESVVIVSAADKLSNARAVIKDFRELGDGVWTRFNAGKPDQLWYYRTVTAVLARRAKGTRVQPLVDELGRAVQKLERLCGAAD